MKDFLQYVGFNSLIEIWVFGACIYMGFDVRIHGSFNNFVHVRLKLHKSTKFLELCFYDSFIN